MVMIAFLKFKGIMFVLKVVVLAKRYVFKAEKLNASRLSELVRLLQR